VLWDVHLPRFSAEVIGRAVQQDQIVLPREAGKQFSQSQLRSVTVLLAFGSKECRSIVETGPPAMTSRLVRTPVSRSGSPPKHSEAARLAASATFRRRVRPPGTGRLHNEGRAGP
jgi:hypothetical protein